ncbi:hypothetical protein D9M71_494080 [compost metagenome]
MTRTMVQPTPGLNSCMKRFWLFFSGLKVTSTVSRLGMVATPTVTGTIMGLITSLM